MKPTPSHDTCSATALPRATLLAGAVLGVAASLGSPAALSAQTDTCDAGRVDRIEIENHSLFAPGDIDDHRFRPILALANWVHIRTRTGYLRNELLVREGDCYEPFALDESARLLRELDFIARVEAEGRQLADSAWAVRLETWDEWSTQASLDFDVENEAQFKGFFVRERNFLGRGLHLEYRQRDFRERQDKTLTLASTRFLGTRANAALEAGTTRTGHLLRQSISYPFVSEAGRRSFASELRLEDWEYAYVTGERTGVSHVLVPLSDLRAEVRYRHRWGEPGALTFAGAEVEVLDREVSGVPRQASDVDFDGLSPAADSLAAAVTAPGPPESWVMLGATIGLRRLRFSTAQGLDLISGVQNVAHGSELSLTLGRSLGTFGTTSAFSWARVDGWAGGRSGSVFAHVEARAEGRLLDRRAPAESRWKDLALRARTLLYYQPGGSLVHTFVTGVRARLRGNPNYPYRQIFGGEDGVRGYREEDVPVVSTLVGFAEHRVNLPWFRPVVDVGLVAFADLGQGWAGEVPFGTDTGWRGAVGGGIRIGFPAGTGAVTHIEVAWPVGGDVAGRGPVLRTYWSPELTSR